MANINENAASSATQREKILDYMLAGNSITAIEALNLFGCFRLASRISDIRSDGYIVYKTMVKDDKSGKRYAQYSL